MGVVELLVRFIPACHVGYVVYIRNAPDNTHWQNDTILYWPEYRRAESKVIRSTFQDADRKPNPAETANETIIEQMRAKTVDMGCPCYMLQRILYTS